MTKIWKVAALMGLVMLCVLGRTRGQGSAQGSGSPMEGSVEATGKLVKAMAVGAEATGWAIEIEKEVSFGGTGVHSIEVEGDVKKFGKLENKKVTVKGSIVHRSGTERKDRMVFVVQKIKEWKAPAAERPSNY